MAIRRVYYLEKNKVKYFDFNIKWNFGSSIQQKQKNVENLHYIISSNFCVPKDRILEVSTKSKLEIGVVLSSFNLKAKLGDNFYPVECVYQSSKVFKNILGEYQIMDALLMSPYQAKARLSMEKHENLCKFRCENKEFPLEPKNMFYDWVYINALKEIPNLMDELKEFDYFTDIEFNPQKSISCQARTLVLYIWLVRNKKLDEYLKNPIKFYRNVSK